MCPTGLVTAGYHRMEALSNQVRVSQPFSQQPGSLYVSVQEFRCYEKTLYTRGLKQQTFSFHSSGGWRLQVQGAGRFGIWWWTSFKVQMATSLLCHHLVERKRESYFSGLFLGTNPSTSNTSPLGIRFQRTNLRGTQTLGPYHGLRVKPLTWASLHQG